MDKLQSKMYADQLYFINRRFTPIIADKDSEISPQRRRAGKRKEDYGLLATGQRTTKFRKTVGSEQKDALRHALSAKRKTTTDYGTTDH